MPATGHRQAAAAAAAEGRPGRRRSMRLGRRVHLGVLPGLRQSPQQRFHRRSCDCRHRAAHRAHPRHQRRQRGHLHRPGRGGYPAGPEIVTTAGKVLWFHRLPAGDVATDFRTQTYLGQPVLTWFQSRGPEGSTGPGGAGGQNSPSGPSGTDYVYNGHYQQTAAIRAGNGDATNFHEFLITPWNTALILASTVTTANLTSIGGPADQRIIDGLVQEIDIRTGRYCSSGTAPPTSPTPTATSRCRPPRALPGTGFTSTPSTSTPTATCW